VAYITLEKLTPSMKEKYYQNYNCGERLTIKNVREFLQNQNEVDSNQLAIGLKNIFNKSMAMEDKQNKNQGYITNSKFNSEDNKQQALSRNNCKLCSGDHSIHNCVEFVSKNPKENMMN
jgi:hypothetical protein